MGEGIAHIISPLSAPWCGWTMLGLLICAVLSEWFQPGIITQAPMSLMVRNDRLYKESPTNFMGQLHITLFRFGTLAMALCLCWTPEGQFSFAAFAAMVGIIALFFVVKMLGNWLLDYTFMFTRRFGAPYEHYSNLLTLAALVLYPVMLILNYLVSPLAARWSVAVIAALFCLLWLYRCIRTYITSPVAIIYIILYFCTLEILPFIGLAYISAKTIAIL